MTTCLNCKATISLPAKAVILLILFLSTACAPETKTAPQKCMLNREHSPVVRGLKLGMTMDEVHAKWPLTTDSPGKYGGSFGKYLIVTDDRKREYVVAGVEFFHERLYSFQVFYVDLINWPYGSKLPFGGEFEERMAGALGLKDQGYVVTYSDGTNWSCVDFTVVIKGSGAVRPFEYPSVAIVDIGATISRDAELKQKFDDESQKKVDRFKP